MAREPGPLASDQSYLRGDQYRDSRNIEARIALHRGFSVNPQGWMAWLFERLRAAVPSGRRSILEIGCGAATLWRENAARVPAEWSLQLTDFSLGMLRGAAQGFGARARYSLADAGDLPFADGCFDVVVANHMLYHVPDRTRALREIRRVLAPRGVLFASTVGERHMIELDEHLHAIGIHDDLQGRAMSAGFTLENGGAQIATVLGGVTLERYADALRVTEVEPLLAYVDSMPTASALRDDQRAALRAALAAEIAHRGHVSIVKDSGVFVARSSRP